MVRIATTDDSEKAIIWNKKSQKSFVDCSMLGIQPSIKAITEVHAPLNGFSPKYISSCIILFGLSICVSIAFSIG